MLLCFGKGKTLLMRQTNLVPKILATAGCLLVWLTILSPLIFGAANVIVNRGRFHVDFLMPAEFFRVALLGSGLLFLTSWRFPRRRKQIGWGLAAAVITLVVSQGLAIVTGLASGEREPNGIWMALVFALLAAYVLALISVGIAGILFLRDLLRPASQP